MLLQEKDERNLTIVSVCLLCRNFLWETCFLKSKWWWSFLYSRHRCALHLLLLLLPIPHFFRLKALAREVVEENGFDRTFLFTAFLEKLFPPSRGFSSISSLMEVDEVRWGDSWHDTSFDNTVQRNMWSQFSLLFCLWHEVSPSLLLVFLDLMVNFFFLFLSSCDSQITHRLTSVSSSWLERQRIFSLIQMIQPQTSRSLSSIIGLRTGSKKLFREQKF